MTETHLPTFYIFFKTKFKHPHEIEISEVRGYIYLFLYLNALNSEHSKSFCVLNEEYAYRKTVKTATNC